MLSTRAGSISASVVRPAPTKRARRRSGGQAGASVSPRMFPNCWACWGRPRRTRRFAPSQERDREASVWILGSTTNGAELAARLGLPFAFAAHFRPDNLLPALAAYRAGFKPSGRLDQPRAIVTVSAIVAETDAEARFLASSMSELALGSRPQCAEKAASSSPGCRGGLVGSRPSDGERAAHGEHKWVVAPRCARDCALLIAEAWVDELMFFGTVHGTEARLEILRDAGRNREDTLGGCILV